MTRKIIHVDMDKPDGLVVIRPQAAPAVLRQLEAARLPGVGRVTAERMRRLGIRTCADLAACPEVELIREFGRAGRRFAGMARGEDDRPVQPIREPKSIGAETTFASDLRSQRALRERLVPLAERVAARLQRKRLGARTVTLKVKYADFESITRRRTLDKPLDRAADLLAVLDDLLQRAVTGERAVRLIGLSVSNLAAGRRRGPEQGLLFSD